MKITVKQLKELIVESMNDLEKAKHAQKAAGRLAHDPTEIEKRKIVKAALNKMPAEKILMFIAANNSIEWLVNELNKVPSLKGFTV